MYIHDFGVPSLDTIPHGLHHFITPWSMITPMIQVSLWPQSLPGNGLFLAIRYGDFMVKKSPRDVSWWVVVYPPHWKIGVRQLGWWQKPNSHGKIKNGNQTTNQYLISPILWKRDVISHIVRDWRWNSWFLRWSTSDQDLALGILHFDLKPYDSSAIGWSILVWVFRENRLHKNPEQHILKPPHKVQFL